MIRIADIPENKFLAYDIETTGKFAPYCELTTIGYQLGLNSEPRILDLRSAPECDRFRRWLADPKMIKISHGGVNFDDIVLARHGFYVEPEGRHDMMLALRTISPALPSFGLKFVNWYFFGDWHEPERRLTEYCLDGGVFKKGEMFEAGAKPDPEKEDPELIQHRDDYCCYDVRQTVNIFCLIWEVVQRPEHWKVYTEMELAMAQPLHEMILLAGEWLDLDDIEGRIHLLELEKKLLIEKVEKLSGGKITNALSPAQVGQYLNDSGVELELGKSKHYSVKKAELMDLMGTTPIAKAVFEIRDIDKVRQHYECHVKAATYEQELHVAEDEEGPRRPPVHGHVPLDFEQSLSRQAHLFLDGEGDGLIAIPKSYTLSGTRTRRFLSGSEYGVNFQNQPKRLKMIQRVPPGWLGCWIDSRQIENVVHIWASGDKVRRAAYEADIDWNEYVWLSNTILGKERSRKELEEIPSEVNPMWSVYKQFKTGKLALNFFMGPAKFAKVSGVTQEQAKALFAKVHRACPAIHQIVEIVGAKLVKDKFVTDPFGHRYASSNLENVNEIVIYLIQGCGTGSVPKAMTIANWQTLHALDTPEPRCRPCLFDRFRGVYAYGVITGTTHDECAFRVSLGLPEKKIVRAIRKCLWNMEERFSPLFDGIPLRAQLAVSLTNAGEQVELDHRSPEFEIQLLDWIRKGKNR